MQKILSSSVPFTAVLASNDESAFGAMQALTQAGLRIPRDVAVVGFDGRRDGFKLPPLTSVYHPVFERGYHAFNMLVDMIESQHVPDDTIVNVSTQLFIRRSCGCSVEDILSTVIKTPTDSAGSSGSTRALQDKLIQTMAITILTESQRSNSGEIHPLK